MDKNNFDGNCDLNILKQKYELLKEKYNLPEFHDLNKLFDIEEVYYDTDFLLRRIRRIMAERINGYSRFVDVILNPGNAPIFFFNLLKKVDSKDKEFLTEIYAIIGNLELEIISLDLEYSEKNEAEFIKKVVNIFDNKIRKGFIEFIKKIGDSKGSDFRKENNKSYFG